MKTIPSIVLGLMVFAACQKAKKNEATTDRDSTDSTAINFSTDNQLTDQQKAEGWMLLFNGQNFDGWKFYKGKENNSWEVKDGTLHCKPFDDADKRADIRTADQYANFELSFDWKISPQSNSGVIYRATEEFNEAYLSGPEYQVLDDIGYPGDVIKNHLTGSVFDMYPSPDQKPINPVGQWNSSRIIANGNHIEHWLNGSKMFEYEINSDAWKKVKAASKWKDEKAYGVSPTGYIDLQDHGSEVWFKNILIKPL